MRKPVGESVEERIVAVIRSDGQMHKRMLCDALGVEYRAIDFQLTKLKHAGEVVILGIAAEAGYGDIRSDAPVYGLPGMTLKPADSKPKPKKDSPMPDDIRIAQPRTIPAYRYGTRGPW